MNVAQIAQRIGVTGMIVFLLTACGNENFSINDSPKSLNTANDSPKSLNTANDSPKSLSAAPETNRTMLLTAPSGYLAKVNHILFAHGLNSNKGVWNSYVDYINNSETYSQRWTVHRFNVSRIGSIEERATQLCEDINDLNLEDDSLIAVGHSMGGLDLRYIVSKGHEYEQTKDKELLKFYTAAKKIHKIYTLATPHRGNMFGGITINNAAEELGVNEMRVFNNKYPITTFSIDGRKVQFLAMRFECGKAHLSDGGGSQRVNGVDIGDGVVAVKRQILFGAPHTQSILRGKHTDSHVDICDDENPLETENVENVLKPILDNKGFYSDRFDIVFYEKKNCEGDENGFYSSTYKRGTIKCGISELSKNDRTSSVKIYPGVHKNLTILLFDDPDADKHDDWLRIHIGDTELSKPICIDNLEHNTHAKESKHDITVTYYNNNGLNGKVSNIKIGDSSKKYGPIDIVAYEDKDCSGNIVAYYNSRKDFSGKCSIGNRCSKNDAIQSVRLLKGVAVGTKISLYNSPEYKRKYGYATIKVIEPLTSDVCIGDLGDGEDNDYSEYFDDNHVKFNFYHHTNMCAINCDVNGHVSYVKVTKGEDSSSD